MRSISKEWYVAAIRKLPEKWQQYTDLGEKYVESSIGWFVASHRQEVCNPSECQIFMKDLRLMFFDF